MQKIKETGMRLLFALCACISILAVVLICWFLFSNGIPAIGEIGADKFLLGERWKPLENQFGIFPMIIGSIYVTAGAVLVGVPIGILCAVFLARFCPPRLHRLLKPAVDLLAGIPSIVYGFFGLVVIVPLVQSLFGGSGKGTLTASVLLGIMILPTIISVTEASIRAVPESYYEGALALGATKERSVFCALMPGARSGITAGVILSAVLSSAVVKRIVKPINAIDPEHPDTDADYEEIAPLLYKIHTQNQEIARQMRTLKKQQEEFRQLTAHMREGLLVADSHCEVLSWNAAALEIFGVPEPSGTRNIYEFNRSEPFRMAVEQALAGQPAEQLLSLGQRSYRMLASPVQEQDAVTGIMVLLLDVTEQEHREQLRREFTSNVSHEMKTPLTAIHAIAGMLVQDVIEPKDVKKFAGDIYRESARMIALVNDTLRLSRMDENGIAEPKEPVDLYDLAEEVIARLRVTAEKKQVAFSLAGTHVTVNGVYSMLEEMIYNLCDNAVKYNKEQGTVTVSVLTAGKEGILMVQDTGIGIPQEDQSRIFERFYRVDKSHSRAIGGTGLGLSIVKHGAAYHNAQVQVSSKPGEGSTFTVIFPETLQA